MGVKPTYGRVSRYGLVAYGSSLDQIGPMTRNVTDAAAMLTAIAGYDKRDSTSVREDLAPQVDYLSNIDTPIEHLKIGVVRQFMDTDGLDAQVAARVKDALAMYEDRGAELIEVSLDHMQYAVATYYLIATAEASPAIWHAMTACITDIARPIPPTISICTTVRARKGSASKSNGGSCWGRTASVRVITMRIMSRH